MNNARLKTQAHSVYGLRYQLILTTYHRRPLLTPRVRTRLAELTRERVDAWSGELLELEAEPDHVAVVLELPPTAAVAEFVRALKTGTSRRLRNEFATLGARARLWDTSYYVTSVAGGTPETLEAYLNKDVA